MCIYCIYTRTYVCVREREKEREREKVKDIPIGLVVAGEQGCTVRAAENGAVLCRLSVSSYTSHPMIPYTRFAHST